MKWMSMRGTKDGQPTVAGPRKWDRRGGEIVGKSQLVEIDELEPIGSDRSIGSSEVEREIAAMLFEGLLGVTIVGDTVQISTDPLPQETVERLAQLGRKSLEARGVSFEVFKQANDAANKEHPDENVLP